MQKTDFFGYFSLIAINGHGWGDSVERYLIVQG